MTETEFITQLQLYKAGSLSPEAEAALLEAIGEFEGALQKDMLVQLYAAKGNQWDVKEKEELLQLLLTTIRVPVRKIPLWKKMAVAASLLAILLTIGYLIVAKRSGQPGLANTQEVKDVKAPASNRAMITLADGRTIYLDSAASGTLNATNNVQISKSANGDIVYKGLSDVVEYNTLFNPRGSKVQPLTLSDGTKLWLNAESSVTYPTAFAGNERKVTITGEAYFEVAHDATKPFFVSKGDVSVQVLGTHFNVNAYDGESDIKITLLEGSVKVNSGKTTGLLKPGQQAEVTSDIKISNNVDVEAVMAWKNGWFEFDQMNLAAIMKQVSRWYNVEIEYSHKVSDAKFFGRFSKDLSLMEILKLLESNGPKFKLEGNKILVDP